MLTNAELKSSPDFAQQKIWQLVLAKLSSFSASAPESGLDIVDVRRNLGLRMGLQRAQIDSVLDLLTKRGYVAIKHGRLIVVEARR